MNPIVLVPARMAATRLPEKPLALIAGEPMVVQVWRRAVEADFGAVAVACDHEAIAEAVQRAGGRAVLTDPELPSGTDRISAAVESLDPEGRHDVVVNVQGDLPNVKDSAIRAAVALLADPAVDIGTPVAPITRPEDADAPSVVKMIGSPLGEGRFRALYFTRARAPSGDGPLYEHVGLYAWRRAALRRFVMLPPSTLELRERLEQLRALEAGMRIDAITVADVPISVDTPDDLARARRAMEPAA